MTLKLAPISLSEANDFVRAHHRHHQPKQGHKFSIAVREGATLVGVCIVGRPNSRALDDGSQLEVTRLCTDGSKNACSMLYGAARRAAAALGYSKIISYILETESGTSLRASGYALVAITRGETWNRKGRPRNDKHPTIPKQRYEALCA